MHLEKVFPNIISVRLKEESISVTPTLYKFFSIIEASDDVRSLCMKKKIVTWLKEKEDEAEVQASQFNLFKKQWEIAAIYARIIAEHVPDDEGDLGQNFKYFDLVAAVKEVFCYHLMDSVSLLKYGIEIQPYQVKFYARCENGKVCIFPNKMEEVHHGGHGDVCKIYEVASRQFLAFKISKLDAEEKQFLIEEINKIERLQDLEGLQSFPLFTFHFHRFSGYVGPLHGPDLSKWFKGAYDNNKRLAMGKSLMRAFANKTHLGIWHGDLKDKNVVTNGDECIIIDWAGSILYSVALGLKKVPKFYTYSAHKDDFNFIMDCRNGLFQNMTEKFHDLVHALDLFSVAIVLFQILSGEKPFNEESSETPWPLVKQGITENAKNKLNERGYKQEIVDTLTKMLCYDYKERYSVQQAIEIWDKYECY